jgi:hypothetical protein
MEAEEKFVLRNIAKSIQSGNYRLGVPSIVSGLVPPLFLSRQPHRPLRLRLRES